MNRATANLQSSIAGKLASVSALGISPFCLAKKACRRSSDDHLLAGFLVDDVVELPRGI